MNVRSDIDVDGVWDIETQDWTTFVAGGVLSRDGTYRDFSWKNERAYFDALIRHGGCLWSHNGGRFDDKWLLDWALRLEMNVQVIKAGARIISMEIGETTFCDSAALIPVSLAELTSDNVRYKKTETGLPCMCGKACGGYCRIRRDMAPSDLAALRRYLRVDCYSLYEAMSRVRRYAQAQDLDLALTIGASAWKNVKRRLGLDAGSLSTSDFKFVRAGYYGGRVQVFRPISRAGFEYDVNSMYPSRLAACTVPVGRTKRVACKAAAGAYRNSRPGIYRCAVHVPNRMLVPPLPYRKGHRIFYPVGTFEGCWSLPEIVYAAEKGCGIEILEGHIWEREENLFRGWVDTLFALRLAAPGGKKGSIGTWLKLYLNSLTGKFGSKAEQESLEICPDEIRTCACEQDGLQEFPDPTCACQGKCCTGCQGWCGAHIKLDDWGQIWAVRKWRIPPAAHPEWAAYLTAQARVEWHRQATVRNGGLDLVYGDTDSIFVESNRTANIGDNLGQWQLQGRYRNMKVIAPKVYYFDREEGGQKVKAKGLRLPKKGKEIDAEKAIAALESGSVVGGSAVVGVKRGARLGKFFVVEEITRRVSPKRKGELTFYGDRILEPGADMTRPPSMKEIDNGTIA